MKKEALYKDIFRNIKLTVGRFMSIMLIVAIGIAFFSGLKIAPLVMKKTADKYYKDYNLRDIQIISSLGLTDEDLKEIKKINNVEQAEGSYFFDVLLNKDGKEIVVRLHSFSNENQIDGVRLIKGRLPKKANECVVEIDVKKELLYPLGSKIHIDTKGKNNDLNDKIDNKKFKVVGAVQTPNYLSEEKGNSNLGYGKIDSYVYIPDENFKLDQYTDILVKVEGSDKLNSYSDNYFKLVDNVRKDIENISEKRENIRYNQILNSIDKKFVEVEKEFKNEKNLALNKLENLELELEDREQQIKDGYKAIDKEKKNLNNYLKKKEKDLKDGKNIIDDKNNTYNILYKEYEKEFLNLDKLKNNIEDEKNTIEEKIKSIDNRLEGLKLELENSDNNTSDISLEIDSLTKMKEDLDNEKKLLNEKFIEKNNILKTKEAELFDLKNRIDNEVRELNKSKLELERNRSEIKSKLSRKKRTLKVSNEELNKVKNKYNKEKDKIENDLNLSENRIREEKNNLKNIDKSKWHILDRNKHYSYVDYEGAADRIDSLAKIFPVFFILVSFLVSLTSMARMVDEQRNHIGTLKALGYTNMDIAKKYIIYAFLAAILGSILGLVIGHTVFPKIIFDSYGLMYMLPDIEFLFDYKLSISIVIFSIVLMSLTAYISCIKELRECSSSLMRPKAPKAGKKILLERISFFWSRLSFNTKVTLRNIFRYKRRFFMTVLGIAGSTALIVTGFGIKDSIGTVANEQFGKIFKFDSIIYFEEEPYDKINLKKIGVEDSKKIHKESGLLKKEENEQDVEIIIPKTRKNFEKYISLIDINNKDNRKVKIPKTGMVISEQVAKTLDIKEGEYIYVENQNNKKAKAKVYKIVKNYTFNYAYMSDKYYKDIFNIEEIQFTELIANIGSKKKLEKQLRNKEIEESIKSISFNKDLKNEFNDIINSLDYVVFIMIISAGGLAFVVLYNLTTINISERTREIATMKVLGFYDTEVAMYIFRENLILTVLGILLGLIMGSSLHKYVMITVEMDNIMFGLEISRLSYIYSSILTIIFSIMINLIMYFKLKSIEMVESLKSIE